MWRCVIISLILMMFLGGCSFKDIDKRLFVIGFGVDKSEDDKEPFHLSLKVTIPSSEGGSALKEEHALLEENGKSITDAINKIRRKVDKELDFGHTKVIIFGSDILPGKVEYLSNWFFRRRDIQQITFIAIADKKAKDVLQVETKTSSQPSYGLIIVFERTGAEQPYIFRKYLFQYRREYFDDGVNPVLPVVKAQGSQQVIENAAVINKKGELLKLSKEETKLVNLLSQNLTEVDFRVQTDDNFITMKTNTIESSFTFLTKQVPPTIKVSINLIGEVEESFEQVSKSEREKAEKKLEKKLNQQVEALLKKFQAKNVDPLEFGIRYRSKQWNDPNSAQRWKKLYPDVTFKVNTNVRIKSTGTVK